MTFPTHAKRLTVPELHELLICDPDAGTLTWKPRSPEMFKDEALGGMDRDARANKWNGRFAGKPALDGINAGGYRYGQLGGRDYSAHYVIWAMTTGSWEPEEIDGKAAPEGYRIVLIHNNGDKTDNRFTNIYVTQQQKMALRLVSEPRLWSGPSYAEKRQSDQSNLETLLWIVAAIVIFGVATQIP